MKWGAARAALVAKLAPLRARHGEHGIWDDLRRIERSRIAHEIRMQAIAEGRKLTETAIEDAAQADPRYLEFVLAGGREKAAYEQLEEDLRGVDQYALEEFQSQQGHNAERLLEAAQSMHSGRPNA